jgi:hypothetical protein
LDRVDCERYENVRELTARIRPKFGTNNPEREMGKEVVRLTIAGQTTVYQ